MKKIIILFVGILLFCTSNGFSQSASLTLGSVSASAGDTVSVPINVANFNNISAISLKISYNTSALTFVGTANSPVIFTSNASGGVIALGWFDATASSPINISSGVLIDLKFVSTGASSSLTFNTSQCDIANSSATSLTNVVYNNGSVASVQPTLKLANVVALSGTNITVPFTVQAFNNVGAISLKIQYDNTALTFTGLSNVTKGVAFTGSVSGGVITVSWFDQTGTNPINLDSAKLFDLGFTYKGGSSSLLFNTSQCDIANSSGISFSNITYVNGSVSPLAGTAPTLSFPTLMAVPNTSVSVPIMANSFKGVGAVSLKIQYNAAVLNFTGVTNTLSGTYFSASASNGVISLSWFDATGHTPRTFDSVAIVDLNFTYIGGSSSLAFLGGQSEISDSVGNVISGIIFDSGSVSMATGIKTVPGIPKEYTLGQNYPNPFNPSTNISFTIPKESMVVLKVYNMLGQEVSTLVNQVMAGGSYNYQFNADNLTSGIYIYRLQAGANMFTKKMTLLK